jgi:alanine-synthesizing transaminase
MFSSRTNWHLEPNRFTRALESHRRGGAPLFDLTASNPTTCGFAYPQKEILAALADPRALQYAPESKGLLEAREAIAEYYRGRASAMGSPQARSAPAEVDAQRILLTSGTSEAYSWVFRLLCEPGDEVLVPAPSYPLFEFLANLADVNLVSYPLTYQEGSQEKGWQIDLDALGAALTPRSRAVLVVHPNNPTGSFVSRREAAQLADLCARRDMALVADEVFLDFAKEVAEDRAQDEAQDDALAAAGASFPGTFALQDVALTFTLSGLSKVCALPQMKLAWLAVSGPETLVRPAVDRLEIIADTYLSPGTPVQLAVPRFLALRGAIQEQLQRRIAANLTCLDAALQASPSVTRLARQGGWYAVLRVPALMPDDEIAVALIERESVLVHPGQFFDFAQDGFLILSLITARTNSKRACGACCAS